MEDVFSLTSARGHFLFTEGARREERRVIGTLIVYTDDLQSVIKKQVVLLYRCKHDD